MPLLPLRRPPALFLVSLLCAGAALAIAPDPPPPAAPSADPLRVHVRDGDLQGREANGVREFLGVPYAAPPTGRLRFELPRPVPAWSGTRDATRLASPCPQPARYGLTEASDDEDCLHLNIATPASGRAGEAPRPVLVWIHGGAFVGGSGGLYPLAPLAKEADLVVVSVNYRLGPLGFLAHPAFARARNGGYGLEDQRAALRWVKQNIAAFGGDPHNVTLAGESAGGASVCLHMVSPRQTAGLFEKAIVQSAGCSTHLRRVEEAEKIGLDVAARVGCAGVADALGCLRGKSAKELVDAAWALAQTQTLAFAPSVGSETLPRQPLEALVDGDFVRVPLLNGGNRDEMRLYVAYEATAGQGVTADTYARRLAALYGPKAAEVGRAYPLRDYPAPAAALGTARSDFQPGGALGNCQFLVTAALASRHVPVYEYEFADRAAPPVAPDPGFEMGAVHSAELPYLFPHISHTSRIDGPDLPPASRPLAALMVAYWGAFAHSGVPSGDGRPSWPRYASDRDVLRLEPGQVHPYDAGAAHHCAMWRRLYPEDLPAG